MQQYTSPVAQSPYQSSFPRLKDMLEGWWTPTRSFAMLERPASVMKKPSNNWIMKLKLYRLGSNQATCFQCYRQWPSQLQPGQPVQPLHLWQVRRHPWSHRPTQNQEGHHLHPAAGGGCWMYIWTTCLGSIRKQHPDPQHLQQKWAV